MSQENVELALRAIDAFTLGDVDALVALLSPDVVWEENPELPGLREVYRGRAEVRDWFAEVNEVVASLHVEVEGLTELGDDRVFAETVLTGRGKGSGVPVGLRFRTVLWFAEGQITRRQVSWTSDEPSKRRAAGVGRLSSTSARDFPDQASFALPIERSTLRLTGPAANNSGQEWLYADTRLTRRGNPL